ncbi:MAG TPA: class IV adenylate cyclase [Bryobacteraceae bacterium]|nr:class IV adenylate cyclase [Bryobacteraceae bacterium]
MKLEIEIKLRLPAKIAKIRRTLGKLGFRVTKPRALESNTLFDNSKRSLRKHGKLIRVRLISGHQMLTFKGPSKPGRYKKRPEIEFNLPDNARLEMIFTHMGYHPVFRYEKYRAEYSKPRGIGKVLVDETPIGNYLELEGPPRWIDRTARLLGYKQSDYITRSYGYLYLAYCRERRIRATDMLFKDRRLKK